MHASSSCGQPKAGSREPGQTPPWDPCPQPQRPGLWEPTHPCPVPHLAAGDRVGWVGIHQGGKGVQEEVTQALTDDDIGCAADGCPQLLTQFAILRGVQPAQSGGWVKATGPMRNPGRQRLHPEGDQNSLNHTEGEGPGPAQLPDENQPAKMAETRANRPSTVGLLPWDAGRAGGLL